MYGEYFHLIYTPSRSLEVAQTSEKFIKDEGMSKIIDYRLGAYYAILDLIPQTSESFWSGNTFPWVDSWNELQISLNLCVFGFYKQAMASLRSVLELGLLSIYWNIDDQGHITIKGWLHSDDKTPRIDEIWKKIEKHPNFKNMQGLYDLKSRLLKLNVLHDFVHTKGFKYSNKLGKSKSNFQTFEEDAFIEWFKTFTEVVEVICILHLIKYPLGVVEIDYHSKFGLDVPMIGGLNGAQQMYLQSAIDEKIYSLIKEIGKQDKQLQEKIAWLDSLPVMSKEDHEEDSLKWDKEHIEMFGLQWWLDFEKMSFSSRDASIENASEEYKAKVKMLTHWAEEHGFDKYSRGKSNNQSDSNQEKL